MADFITDLIARTNQVQSAARDIAGIIDREGTWDAEGEVQTIRDMASFTIEAPSGERFTVAVSPVRNDA